MRRMRSAWSSLSVGVAAVLSAQLGDSAFVLLAHAPRELVPGYKSAVLKAV